MNDLSKVLSKKITPESLLTFIYPLIECLSDAQTTSSSGVWCGVSNCGLTNTIDCLHSPVAGVCVVINGVLRLRGGELEAEVPSLLNILQKQV